MQKRAWRFDMELTSIPEAPIPNSFAHLRAIGSVIARGAFNWLAIARGNAEAGQVTKPSVDPPRPAGPAARLSRLRIAGFKSFADPVELAVLPGLAPST